MIAYFKCVQYFSDNPLVHNEQSTLSFDVTPHSPLASAIHYVPVHEHAWTAIIEFVYQFIIAPVIHAKNSHRLHSTVYLTQPTPKQKDWTEEYKQNGDANLILNHLSASTNPFPTEIINSVHFYVRSHLHEDCIKLVQDKLTCYLPVSSSDGLAMLLIVPNRLRRLLFDAYHTSGIGGHLGINKTLVVLRLRFLWPSMRKDIITWVRACLACIHANNTTYVSKQLVHSWPLLTPFAVISVDIWSPSNITSPTGAKCLLNSMCHMSQFVVCLVISHANSAELARAFMEIVRAVTFVIRWWEIVNI